MTKSKTNLLTLAAILMFSFVGANGQSKVQKDSRNVLDYFNLAVQEIKDVKNYPRDKFRVKDLKNGFLEIENDDFYRQVALFRKDNGKAILVIATHGGGPAAHTYDLDAYEIYEGESDLGIFSVTEKVFPRLAGRENVDIYNKKRPKEYEAAVDSVSEFFELPRRGRVIKVYGNEDANNLVKLYELHLKNDRFVIVRK